MKRKHIFHVLALIVTLLTACNKDGNVPPNPPPSESEDSITLFRASYAKHEIKSFTSSNGSGTVPNSAVKEYFGARIQSFLPITIDIKTDSVILHKKFGIREGYRAKEQDKSVLIAVGNGEWISLGNRTGDSFTLNAVFYFQNMTGQSNARTSIGQQYGNKVTAITASGSSEQAELVTLEILSIYEHESND